MRKNPKVLARSRDIESAQPDVGSLVRKLRRAAVFAARAVFRGKSSATMSKYERSQIPVHVDEDQRGNRSNQDNHTRNGSNVKKAKTKMLHSQLDSEHGSDKGMTEMNRVVDSVRRSLAEAEDMYDQLFQDIQDAVHNRIKVGELETKCQKQQDAIDSMMERSGKKDEKLEQKRLEIVEAEMLLEKKRAGVEKFAAREELKAKEADLKRNQTNEAQMKKQRASLEDEFKDRQERLEKELKQREEQKKETLVDLEAENKRLSNRVKRLETDAKSHVESLAIEKESYEDMEKLKKLSKEEATRSQHELQKMKGEFGLQSNTPEFFQNNFGEIYRLVHTISTKFCQDLDQKDWSSIHARLTALDPAFQSVPISGSQDSKLLRISHAERIISFQLSNLIFKPFSSDSTFQPEQSIAVNLLENAVIGLEKYGDSKRVAAVFKSLAMRGLQSHSLSSKTSSACGRTEAVLLSVAPVLSLLVPESQYTSLEDALRALVQSAITLWTSGQSDEILDIKASLNLDSSRQKDWQSPDFDSDGDTKICAPTSPTHSRVLTLFPSITAKVSTTSYQLQVKMPGSFGNSKSKLHTQDICIHAGFGLSGSSALVLRGEQEACDIEEELEVVKLKLNLEAAAKELSDRSKIKMQRNSSGSETSSGTPSPSA